MREFLIKSMFMLAIFGFAAMLVSVFFHTEPLSTLAGVSLGGFGAWGFAALVRREQKVIP